MKLNFGRKLILFIHWLLSLAACIVAVFFCVWPDVIYRGFDAAYATIGKGNTDIIGMVILALYAIFMIASIAIILSKDGKRGDRGFIMVDSSEAGKTRIAISAVEQMIRQAVHGVDGISEMKSGIVNNEDAISINTSVTIANGAHVPTVTMNIQRAIRSYIELNCGVAVREVSVNVTALESVEESRRGRGRKSAPEAVQSVVDQDAPVEAPLAKEVTEPEPIQLQLDPIMEAAVQNDTEEPEDME